MTAQQDAFDPAKPAPHAMEAGLPRVHVVVPAFNEELYVGACLESLRQLDYPAELLQVTVVDNGSTDRTVSIVENLGFHVISHPGARVGGVRNQGAQQGHADILAFLDADCVTPRGWVRSAVSEFMANPRAGAVGGAYLAPSKASWWERAWAPKVSVGRRLVQHLAGGSLFVRSSLFAQFNGFNAALNAGEDEEFCRRLGRAGHEIVELSPCAVVHLGWPKNFREIFLRQRWLGSNQIQSAGRVTDKLLILVHVFTASIFALPVLMLWLSPRAVPPWVAVALILGIPALAAINRSSATDSVAGWFARRLQLWLIFFGFFCGRGAGLLLNYRHMVTRQNKKIGKKKVVP